MKLLFVCLSVAIAAVAGMPHGPEFAMVPDSDGSWKLVNIHEDPEPQNFFDPEVDIIFTLFTRNNREGQVIRWDDPSWIPGSTFNPANPTKITVHGWNGGATSRVNGVVHEHLFRVGEFNCITVDWSVGASTNNYIAARNRVGHAGAIAARLLRMLSDVTGADLRQMSAIGHSLGGHVVGFIGKNLNGQLGSVVALDAALPLFSIDNPDGRTAANDAIYVESMHTNAGLLGFDEPIGQTNFYPNWGRSQPGCGVDVTGNCAHQRTHEFFAESITSTVGFWARQCRDYSDIVNQNCVQSGENTLMGGEPLRSTGRTGVFWLPTRDAVPYAMGPL